MNIPTLKSFKKSWETAVKANRQVVTIVGERKCNVLPDPLCVYATLLHESHLPACLLESGAHIAGKGRFSFVCAFGQPFAIASERESLNSLKQLLREKCPLPHKFLPFVGGAVGYIGHEAITLVESTVKAHENNPFNLPFIDLHFFGSVIVFDHKKNAVYCVANVSTALSVEKGYETGCQLLQSLEELVDNSQSSFITPDLANAESISSNLSKDEYMEMVLKAKEHIKQGDVFQIVLSRRLSVPFKGQGLSLYKSLRDINPSPYLFHMRFDDNCKNAVLVGASPEIMVKVGKREITVRPLAGTKKRGATPEEDVLIEKSMLEDPKETAEHRMLVDLARNDIGKFCSASSVSVTKLMVAEYFSHVMHIGSEVKGKLRKEVHPFDGCIGSLPAGTLSGAPKVEALKLISQLEPTARGTYGGAFGWFTDKALDTCILIRSALLLEGTLHFQTGAGIVYDSDPSKEFEETETKALAMKKALRNMEK